MSTDIDFKNGELADMAAVGTIDPHSVRIWLRTEQPGKYRIEWWPCKDENRIAERTAVIPEKNENDNTTSFQLPGNAQGEIRLRPLTRYRYRITRYSDEAVVVRGIFETAPEHSEATPSPFSIALMSCNQPYDEQGRVQKASLDMLQAVKQCLRAHKTKFVFMMGDQMYSDLPEKLSLFDKEYFSNVAPAGRRQILDCTPTEVRSLYHRRYRHFWNLPDWKAIQAEFPCYPIVDDHDIIDNWGSDPAHEQSEWRSIIEGARMSYFDYQASRLQPSQALLPEEFHYHFIYGHTATFIMDIRSKRRAGDNARLFSDEQETALKNFLYDHQYHKVLFIVLSVPIIHLPRLAAKIAARITHSGEDFSDRWSSGGHIRDRDRILKILHRHQTKHPFQQMVLLSGDIHIGCVHKILWNRKWPVLHQFISSGITHYPGYFIQLGSRWLIRMNHQILTEDKSLGAKVELVKGIKGHKKNPFGGMNLGIVEIETPSPDAVPRLRFLLYGHRGGEPVRAFASDLIVPYSE